MWSETAMWLVVLLPLTMAVIVGVSAQYKSLPPWFHKVAFLIRSFFKAVLYIFLIAFGLFVVLPLVFREGTIWLFPNSTFGYSMKYGVDDKHVYVEPKPHDCEWGKAPIGNKYCHFDRVVTTDKDRNGKITAVYVNWEKVEE